ncbi:glycosyltransferase [Streptomyces sp. GD-15H]|uniref:glycosyltransferase n=1 Tax=Streptomyces sp. GD-15H TaxID=3129112 RepID=UPI0032440ECA
MGRARSPHRGRPERHRPGPLPLRPGAARAHPAAPRPAGGRVRRRRRRPARPGKRFDVLVHALARLPDDHWLLLVGGGPEEHLLRRTVSEVGVTGRVLFTGERPYGLDGSPGPDLPSLMSAMDLLASPSAEEAFGLAAVEALASGLPVLYASCPAIEDAAPSAAAGARRVRGGPEAYARAIAEVRAAGLRPRTASEVAQRYSITRSTARLMDVYAAAVSRSPSSLSPLGASTS